MYISGYCINVSFKGNIHKKIFQPFVLYGVETVSMTITHVMTIEMAEYVYGHATTHCRLHVGNDNITERLKVENIAERWRKRVGSVRIEDVLTALDTAIQN